MSNEFYRPTLGEKALYKARSINESDLRKMQPVGTLVTDYFPDALRAVAAVAWAGDRKHNPGKPTGSPPSWSRDKSADHIDAMVRHLQGGADWDRVGEYEVLHAAEAAWRALARLQLIVELRSGEVIRKIEPVAPPGQPRMLTEAEARARSGRYP